MERMQLTTLPAERTETLLLLRDAVKLWDVGVAVRRTTPVKP